MADHTPTPWAVMGNRGDIKSVCKGFPETMVAKAAGQPTRDERAANAAFIVEAVNNHDALVKHLYHLAMVCCDDDALRLLDSITAPVGNVGSCGK